MASLSQEVVRRCKNTSENLTQEEKDNVINRYAIKLLSSGHSRAQTHSIITAGLKGYEKMLQKQEEGITNIHRPSSEGLAARNRKKLLSRTNWFKPSSNKDPARQGSTTTTTTSRRPAKQTKDQVDQDITTTTVLFVDQTPGGKLAKLMREHEKLMCRITGFRVKVVERNGTNMKQLLHNPNPWAEGICERKNCYPCETGDTKCCFTRNIVYSHRCTDCSKVYIGESSRSSNERGGEHRADFNKEKSDSHQFKHVQTDHAGQEPPSFEFRVVAKFNSALTRQISEAVMIRRREGKILNSKGVFNRCRLPRLTLEDQPKQDRNEAVQNLGINDTEEWHKQADRRKRKCETRERQAKKVKIDVEAANQPRQEGYSKRKSYESKNEFEAVCKRLRPEFNPENELEAHQDAPAVGEAIKELKSNYEPIIFFSIFSKTNRKLNHEVMFKPSAKLKAIQSKRKQKKKVQESLINRGGPNQSKNIKDYFKIIGQETTIISPQSEKTREVNQGSARGSRIKRAWS